MPNSRLMKDASVPPPIASIHAANWLFCIALRPAVHRRVVNRDASLAHHLLELAIADAVTAVPTNRQRMISPPKCRHRNTAINCPLLAIYPTSLAVSGRFLQRCAFSRSTARRQPARVHSLAAVDLHQPADRAGVSRHRGVLTAGNRYGNFITPEERDGPRRIIE